MLIPFGIIPALVTPLTRDDEINESALRKLTDYVIDGGVHGVFATGSQGEFWAFSAEEKLRTWEVVVDQTNRRVPVYAGTGAITTRDAVRLTQKAEKIGVDAVSVLTPYFITPNDDELYLHYKTIASKTNLPVILYTNPARTNVKLSAGLVVRLAKIDNIVGIKDSSGDLTQSIDYIGNTPQEFSVLMGRDTMIFTGLLHCAKGAIAATGNVAPNLVVKIYDCFIQGNIEGARKAQEALTPLRMAFTWGTFPVVIKEALDILGMDGGPSRAPVGPLTPDQHERLKKLLTDMQLIH
jgi:4-hydroxy-tetrahydrodipicolinate synthase